MMKWKKRLANWLVPESEQVKELRQQLLQQMEESEDAQCEVLALIEATTKAHQSYNETVVNAAHLILALITEAGGTVYLSSELVKAVTESSATFKVVNNEDGSAVLSVVPAEPKGECECNNEHS